MNNLPATQNGALTQATFAMLSIAELKNRVGAVRTLLSDVMEEGKHYGKVPGTDKPTLLKPGADLLLAMFQFRTEEEIKITELGGGHREYLIITSVRDINGQIVGQGVGSCSTAEPKFRFLKAQRLCPACGKAAIIKGKREYGGGWICFAKKGGCGAKFADGEEAIESQPDGKVEREYPAEQYNTVLKMGKKRAHTDAALTVTGASEMFTQDMDELLDEIADTRAVNAASAQKQVQATKSLYRYDICNFPVEQLEELGKYLSKSGASQESETVWTSTRELKKLKNYEITEE